MTERSDKKLKNMSPRTKEQYEDIRENKKSLILETALTLFAENGYHTTSISSIAKKAGISKGLLYNYFESKEELLIEILEAGINKLVDSFDPDKDGELTEPEFRFFIEMTFETLKQNRDYWHLYFSLSFQPTVSHLIKKKFRHLADVMLQIMERFYHKKGHKNPKMQALLFGACMDGISLNYIMDHEQFPIDEMRNYIIDNYLNFNNHEKN